MLTNYYNNQPKTLAFTPKYAAFIRTRSSFWRQWVNCPRCGCVGISIRLKLPIHVMAFTLRLSVSSSVTWVVCKQWYRAWPTWSRDQTGSSCADVVIYILLPWRRCRRGLASVCAAPRRRRRRGAWTRRRRRLSVVGRPSPSSWRPAGTPWWRTRGSSRVAATDRCAGSAGRSPAQLTTNHVFHRPPRPRVLRHKTKRTE